jgi:hypothetical protein
MSSCLGYLFPVARESEAPTIYIKDKYYEFDVNPEKIKKAETIKFYGT